MLPFCRYTRAWFAVVVIVTPGWLFAQPTPAFDPIFAAQQSARHRAASPVPQVAGATLGAVPSDPIFAAQVLAAAEKHFPNIAAELESAELLRKAAADPSMRGNLRGRIAEADWLARNGKDGWNATRNANAPQNDAWRRLRDGRLEGAQVKVHSDWRDYLRSMLKDDKSEHFVIPDDHFELVFDDLEKRRLGAARGGLAQKATEYAAQQRRLVKHGRTFAELDSAVGTAAKHYTRIARAMRAAGKAASYLAVAASLLEGGLAVYEVAVGKAEVDELALRLGKIAVGGGAFWAAGTTAAGYAAAAGATGNVPVAVAIIVGTATYLVVDWAYDNVAEAAKVTFLSAEDVKRVWPDGARGTPLSSLYAKPVDALAIPKK